MTDDELCELIVDVVRRLDKSEPGESATSAVEPLRFVVEPSCHVGASICTRRQTLEWYAGQILDIIDNRSWFAVNSLVNCCKKFTGVDL